MRGLCTRTWNGGDKQPVIADFCSPFEGLKNPKRGKTKKLREKWGGQVKRRSAGQQQPQKRSNGKKWKSIQRGKENQKKKKNKRRKSLRKEQNQTKQRNRRGKGEC